MAGGWGSGQDLHWQQQHHMRHGRRASGQRGIGMIREYVVTRMIGRGSFGVVWKAYHMHNSEFPVAIKEISTDRFDERDQKSLRREVAILKRVHHRNIIRMHDFFEVPGERLHGPNRMYLVLEYCAGGNFAEYIQRHGKVSGEVAHRFMRQLGAGLEELRKENIIHRDLKPQNLLLSTDDGRAVLKIADFGLARLLLPQDLATTFCGSRGYTAPEILQRKKYDAKADLWSVGVILYELVTGRPPFSGNNHVELLQNIKSTGVLFPEAVRAQLHPDCIDLCGKLLRSDPVNRITYEDFFAHPFARKEIKESTKLAEMEARMKYWKKECRHRDILNADLCKNYQHVRHENQQLRLKNQELRAYIAEMIGRN